MEELNKTQLILLALLLSFVTSIATGIVTVTLMDEAPASVVQTINRIVEKTVEVVSPAGEVQIVTQEKIVSGEDLVSSMLQKNVGGVVAFYTTTEGGVRENVGSGFVVSESGLVATNAAVGELSKGVSILAQYRGKVFHVKFVLNEGGNVSIVQLSEAVEGEASGDLFKTLSLASDEAIKLGSAVIGIDATEDIQIASGIITRLEKENTTTKEDNNPISEVVLIHTDISLPVTVEGGPLILSDGAVAGVAFISKDGKLFAVPSRVIRKMLDTIKQKETGIKVEGQSASVLPQKEESIVSPGVGTPIDKP